MLVKELALRWNGKGFPGGRNSLQRNGGNKNYLMVEINCIAAQKEIGGGNYKMASESQGCILEYLRVMGSRAVLGTQWMERDSLNYL